MAKRSNAKKTSNLRLWTILCLLLVFAAALALRGVIVYKLYPLEYEEQIVSLSEEYSLDKFFVCAVICTESHFNESAVSHQGAVGLMQIMPDTGEWAAGHIGMSDYEDAKLSDPDVNLRIGCWYLSYLMDKFGGDYRKVLAAYNAGPAKVQEWLKDDNDLSDIPYEETEKYLERVMRNYEIYKGLYADL